MKAFDPNIMKNVKAIAADTFQTRQIEISKLHPNEKNFYSMTDIELLAEDIERQGLNQNFVVTPKAEADGEYIIISGHRRFAAMSFLIAEGRYKSKHLPCIVREKSEDELEFDLIMDNATARVLTDSDIMQQYRRLREYFEKKKANGERFGRVRERIAEKLQVSTMQVAKIENIDKNATEELKKAVDEGDISISTAHEVAKLDKNEQQKLLEKTPVSEISKKDVISQVKNGVTSYTENNKNENGVTSYTENSDKIENKNVPSSTQDFAPENRSNNACLGYAIDTCKMMNFETEQTREFVSCMKSAFEIRSVSEARKLYENSDY
jgi:ParB family chromosome partitioning protein